VRLAARFGIRRDDRGVSVVEFGLLAPVLCMMLLGMLDLGQRMYLMSVLQGTLFRAARKATIGDMTTAQIDTFVNDELKDFKKNATVTITKKSYSEFTGVKQLEKITTDTAPLGTYNMGKAATPLTPAVTGDCYEDTNGNGTRDDKGISGLGQSDEIVYYQVTVVYPRVVPLFKFLGFSNNETVTANTVLRNQPYGAQIPSTPSQPCTDSAAP
jgi:Flp pilus assembly protein TadG